MKTRGGAFQTYGKPGSDLIDGTWKPDVARHGGQWFLPSR